MPVLTIQKSFIDHRITSMEARGIDLAVKVSSLWPLHIADYTLTDAILRMKDDSVFFRFKAFRESIEGDTREIYSEGSTSDGVGSSRKFLVSMDCAVIF